MKRTTPQQFEKLVALMKNNPDVARGQGNFGSTKRSRTELWEHFALEINDLGPPIRNGAEWNKVWLDYKLKLKKKISTNRNETTATGGGPYVQRSLSALEREVDDLQLQQAANPTGNVLGTPRDRTTARENEYHSEESEGEHGTQPPRSSTMTPTTTPRPRLTVDDRENIRLMALQKQSEVQDTLCQGVLKIGEKIDDIARYSRKIYEQKKEELKLLKEKEERKKVENIEKKRQHQEKMEIKLKGLELKTLKYSLNEN